MSIFNNFSVKQKPIFTGSRFGFGYSQAASSGGDNFGQLFTISSTTVGDNSNDYAIVDAIKLQSDGIIVSGERHAVKFAKDSGGSLSTTTSCRVFTTGTCHADLYNDNTVSLTSSPADNDSDGGTLNVTTGSFSNYIRQSSSAKGYLYQQTWGRGGTYYTSGSGWLDGSPGDFKAYWMHSSQTTFDSFSDGNFGNSNFAYISVITNAGTDYFCGFDNGSSDTTGRKLLMVSGPTTSQDIKHNVNFTRTSPETGWYPTRIGIHFNSFRPVNNAYVTSTDSYIYAPTVGVVRLSGSSVASREGANFSGHTVTGIGDFDSSNYLITLTGRTGQSDSKYTYLLKRAAGTLSSANTGSGYKITNTSGGTDYGLIGCSAQYDSATGKIYWIFVWEDTSNNTNAGVLALNGDFTSNQTFTVGSNTFTVTPETGTFSSSTNSTTGGGGASNNNYGTSTQTDNISTSQLSSNYTIA